VDADATDRPQTRRLAVAQISNRKREDEDFERKDMRPQSTQLKQNLVLEIGEDMVGSHVGAWHFRLSQSATLQSPMSLAFCNLAAFFSWRVIKLIDPFNLLFKLSAIASDCP
jgi:hypothetical protein